MSETRFRIFPDLYKDSVELMQIGAALRKRPGVEEASCVMATPANLAQLGAGGLTVDVEARPSDLLLVVRGEPDACAQAIDAADALLHAGAAATHEPTAAFALPLASIGAALDQAPDADLALISVPGDYAAAEAMKALSRGLHVMLFSDNVSLDEERAVKRYAAARDRLVMGPDCGTAIINGIPLGFANVVRRGDIGLVAASGTGLQEVTCRIHNLGGGVSQAIGTGGRDLHEKIGGATMLQGLAALAQDVRTRVIVLVSKPPAPAVASRILDLAMTSGKPAVVHFLGADGNALRGKNLHAAQSLAHAADLAVALSTGDARVPADPADSTHAASSGAMAPAQRAVRGLFCGGTFCYEAQLAFVAQGLRCRSNAPVHGALPLDEASGDNAFIDLGDDEYTRGRPHPMIDPGPRNAAVRAAGRDPRIAAILFDVVLGYGAHPDPADELAQALADAQREAAAAGRTLVAIGHVCGTDDDPQVKAGQVRKLTAVGALVADSNIHAATLAANLAARLARG
jgi:succinyl-CoA synthetase alpha subunit